MKFNGDIIITDPCYICHKNKKKDIWQDSDIDIGSGSGIEKYGFTNFIWESTIYGDWSCTTYELKEKSKNKLQPKIKKTDIIKTLGNFCADVGLVSVFLLDEVLKYNRSFKYHLERPWTTTLIRSFNGDIIYETNDDEAWLRGIGNINFITMQTGL